MLRSGSERTEASSLAANSSLGFVGCNIYGSGFVIADEERAKLASQEPESARIIFPFMGGEEINTSPLQSHHRYVINFGMMSESEAAKFHIAFQVVRERVKPYRDGLKPTALSERMQRFWWQFYSQRDELRRAIAPLEYCLAASQVSKHLVIARQPTDRVFAHTVNVFAIATSSAFALLQSRAHESWARLLSSSLEDRLRYSASECFDTFPFPQSDPRVVIPALEEVGERLYTKRATYMVDTQQGLTQTYNALKDPRVNEARVVELRQLHEEMDRAVLAAYRWDDLAVPPYGTPTSDAEKKALERFEDEVIDRLFALNAKRADEERAAAEREAATKPAKAKSARKKKGDEGGGQGDLGIE
jgi:hypothetical protein